MPFKTVSSGEARTQWRDLLDGIQSHASDVVIERYGKPIATLIPFADYQAVLAELDDLRATRGAAVAYEAWKQDPSLGRPWDEIEAELVDEGLLDA